jgi:hypothetical protein
MTVVYNTLLDPTGNPVVGSRIEVALITDLGDYERSGWDIEHRASILSRVSTVTNAEGRWQMDLQPNASISPVGTFYRIIEMHSGNRISRNAVIVPVSETDVWLGDILVDQPQAITKLIPAGFIDVNGEDLLTIISDLQARIEQLEQL